MKRLVTVDFDGTLGEPRIQRKVQQLMNAGYEIRVLSAREVSKDPRANADLYSVAHRLGIKTVHLVGASSTKSRHIESWFPTQCLMHLDDDPYEVEEINDNSAIETVGVYVDEERWEETIDRILAENENQPTEEDECTETGNEDNLEAGLEDSSTT